jgi:hypothetical protein
MRRSHLGRLFAAATGALVIGGVSLGTGGAPGPTDQPPSERVVFAITPTSPPDPVLIPGLGACNPQASNMGHGNEGHDNHGSGNQGNCNVGDGNQGDGNVGDGNDSKPPEDE